MSPADREQYQQFQDVFRTYYSQLCNYALTFTKDAEASEDLVQDLFIKIWESRRHLLRDQSVRYYLFTAIRNNCISWLRREKQLVIVPWNDHDAAEEPEVYPKETPDRQKDEMALLQQAIELLPPKCKEVFLLSRFSKLSYKEIATELNISQKTVENQLSKALKVIRSFLKQGLITFIATVFLNRTVSDSCTWPEAVQRQNGVAGKNYFYNKFFPTYNKTVGVNDKMPFSMCNHQYHARHRLHKTSA